MEVRGYVRRNGDVKLIVRHDKYNVIHEEVLSNPTEAELINKIEASQAMCIWLEESRERSLRILDKFGVKTDV